MRDVQVASEPVGGPPLYTRSICRLRVDVQKQMGATSFSRSDPDSPCPIGRLLHWQLRCQAPRLEFMA